MIDWLGFLCGWWWSKWTRFLDAGRKLLGFSLGIEIYLVIIWVVDIDLVFIWVVDIDFTSA